MLSPVQDRLASHQARSDGSNHRIQFFNHVSPRARNLQFHLDAEFQFQPCCQWGDLTGLICQVFDLGRSEFRAGDPDAWLGRGIADGRALLVGIGESGCFVTTSETAVRATRDKPRTHLSLSAACRGGESRPSDRSAARRANERLLQRESSACAGVNQEHLTCLSG